MKETDTETSVIWPSWCYTDNIPRNVLKECAEEIERDLYTNINDLSSKITTGTREVTTEREHIESTSDCNTRHNRSQTSSPATAPPPAHTTLSLIPIINVGEKKMLSERSLLLSGYSNNNTIDSVKTNCEKSNTPPLSGVPLPVQGAGLTITPTTTAAAAAAYLYLEKVKNERMSPRVTAAQLDSLKDAIMESSAAAAAVAAAMVNNNNSNSINNNNNNNHSNSINSSTGSGSGSASNCSSSSINNNLVNSQVQNQIANNSINNTSDELQSHSLAQSCSQIHHHQQQQQLQKQTHHQHHLHHQPQQQQQSLHMNSNHVKKERLSPGTNGDLQTTLSRSRSTTPSSFRGTSPQQSVHSSPSETLVPMHNLSTNLLNSIHQAAASNRHGNLSVSSPGISNANPGLPADFSTRNYSDFMRSLAAKYNNANPNDNLKRNTLFEPTVNNITSQKKASTLAQKTSYAPSPTTPINKEVSITTTSTLPPPPPLTSAAISPGESALKLTQQNKLAAAVANAAAACTSNVSPYMTSFLSSLPFSPGIFPPLIDMSSTQALITLARAAKENEIHNILSASSQHPKRSAASTSPSPSPSLNMALQQAAQFISPALIYSAQLQKQQLQQQQHQQQQQASRQSSPRLANISNSTTSSSTSAKNNRNLGEKLNVSPLDLSSQPPASKRFKAESTSSQSSNDGLIHTTITRRASSSTATTSPSPPPLNEKSLNTNASIASPAATASAVVGSSTKTEATTTAFTPIKVASSTSATSSIAPAVTVRQCQAQSEELNSWTVDDVCAFVGSIDICAEYVKHFRDQCIDGSGLPLLTEDHLVNSLGMKLGPALKLRSVLAKKLGGPCPCVSCVAQVQQVLALQTGGMTAAATTAATFATTTTSSDHTTSSISANVIAVGSSSNSSGSCNSHLPKNPLSSTGSSSTNCTSYNSSNNSSSNSVNKNESTTAPTTTTSSTNTISTNSSTTNVCNNDANTPRSNSNCNTNVGHFSSPPSAAAPPPQPPITQQPQQHHLHQQQQQHSPSQNICSNDNSNPTSYRHDNVDSSS